ncbi:NAD(P)-dependent oxidoreductase [Candidatus Protofrankia californiensis]|uniref:NAD(P)-dependent oxidoreductase n=1 Tax=Candidatus Protofrankia californiensis TaxID=1839754 RepID=UPI0010416343|nr:NAD(P)-dependent oxidoreductase [Candidatus Protofrankia californiensis]
MPAIVAVRGSADLNLLGKAVPGAAVHEIHTLEEADPEQARTADVLVLRSGVRLGAAQLPDWPALRHVIRAGSGLDGIDTSALAARGIALHRNTGPAAYAVAEWALVALLSLARRIPYGQAALAAGEHAKTACLTEPVSRMRLAIWGAGPVGRACGRLLRPHVRELAYAARPSVPAHLPQRPADTLPAWADSHLVALPLGPQTMRLFGGGFLSAARHRSPLLICVGRLGTLDLPACLEALACGDLSGLALDPIDQDDLALLPTGGPPLNLLATPHIGAQRTDVRSALDAWVASTAHRVLTPTGSQAR